MNHLIVHFRALVEIAIPKPSSSEARCLLSRNSKTSTIFEISVAKRHSLLKNAIKSGKIIPNCFIHAFWKQLERSTFATLFEARYLESGTTIMYTRQTQLHYCLTSILQLQHMPLCELLEMIYSQSVTSELHFVMQVMYATSINAPATLSQAIKKIYIFKLRSSGWLSSVAKHFVVKPCVHRVNFILDVPMTSK